MHSFGNAVLRLRELKREGCRRGVRTGFKGLQVRERYRCRKVASIADDERANARHDRRVLFNAEI